MNKNDNTKGHTIYLKSCLMQINHNNRTWSFVLQTREPKNESMDECKNAHPYKQMGIHNHFPIHLIDFLRNKRNRTSIYKIFKMSLRITTKLHHWTYSLFFNMFSKLGKVQFPSMISSLKLSTNLKELTENKNRQNWII